ncbi:MAG: hypothetical protein AB8G86_10570 [Saprospiraceae bacterium]
MKKRRKKYKEKADEIVKLIELAEEVILDSKELTKELKDQMIDFGNELKNLALNPKPQFRKVASLKYLENDFLIYWNETKGVDVENFWKKISTNKLTFKRKDILQKILKRKRIKDIHEYNVIVDKLVIAQQLEQINKEEFKLLSRLIGEFEEKR